MTVVPFRTRPLDIAVVGSGIAGLSAAWLLSRAHKVTLYEKEDLPGGHANTVPAGPAPDGRPLAVDTGFIVYNETNYPNLVALFRHLGLATLPTRMSFAVSLDDGRVEYAGGTRGALFAQRRNLARPRFWRMLADLLRFYREAPRALQDGRADRLSLGEMLRQGGYSEAFVHDHLLPMAAAIWSCPPRDMLDYPAAAFIRFCDNHGLLRLAGRPVWRTVEGGSRRYVDRLIADMPATVRCSTAVQFVRRTGGGVEIQDRRGEVWRHDQVVMATHADQALALLEDASPLERSVLGAFRYQRNLAVLHTDPGLMPRRREVWSSWNYLARRGAGGAATETALSVTYWMNRLQSFLPADRDLFVTLNPLQPPRDGSVLRSFLYDHPVFTQGAVAAQARLHELQGRRNSWFCGSYFGAGFHEDGLQAGLAVAEALGGVRRPWQVANESGRLPRPVVAREVA
jgi:predicted NAD/FAD-binding protein